MLIVDDDPDIRQLSIDRLSGAGYDVDTAAAGAQALRAIQESNYCGVLLDIGIPGTDGLQVLRQSRKSNQLVPIVFITPAESKDLAIRSIGLGAQAYVLKPFGPKTRAHRRRLVYTLDPLS